MRIKRYIKAIKDNKKTILIILFFLLLFYGSFIRLYGLEKNPLWFDESISALTAKNIYEKGVPVLNSEQVYGRAYVFHYMMSAFLFFGQTDFNVRLISVIFGIATCVLIFFIGKEYNDETAWMAFIFSLFLEIFIVYSQQARMYQAAMFFFFLALFFLYKGLDNKKYFFYAILIFLLAYDTNPLALALLPFFVYVIFRNKMNKYYYIGLLIAIIYFLPSIWHNCLNFNFFYLKNYMGHLKYYLPFLFVSIVGIIMGFKKRITFFLGISSVFLLLGFGSYILFAFRYIYVVFLPLIIFASFAISRIKFKWAVFFIYLLSISNIFLPISYVAVIKPEISILHQDFTAPRIDFKSFYDEFKEIYANETLIVSITPATEWYFKKPDFWTYFSFTGLHREPNSTYSIYDQKDVYTGADVIYNMTDFDAIKGEKIVVLDYWGGPKIDRGIVDFINDNCILILEKKEVVAYRCLDEVIANYTII